MENNVKFTLTVNKLEMKISELNIKILNAPNNLKLKEELDELLNDKNCLYKGTVEEVKKIIEKYGENFND